MAQCSWPVLGSCRTRWRWLKVPRSVSWPVRRIGMPSVSSEAKASASACAHTSPSPLADGLAALLELLDELGVDGEAVGHREQLLVEHLQPVLGDRGLDLRRRRAIELVLAGRVLDAPWRPRSAP